MPREFAAKPAIAPHAARPAQLKVHIPASGVYTLFAHAFQGQTVFLKDFVKPSFVVAGEVAHPGTFELRGDIGIIQAIAMSGGFKDSARRTQVVLVRKYNAQIAEVKVWDMRKLMSPKGIREDITLRPGDMLVVPRSTIGNVDLFVQQYVKNLIPVSAFFPIP